MNRLTPPALAALVLLPLGAGTAHATTTRSSSTAVTTTSGVGRVLECQPGTTQCASSGSVDRTTGKLTAFAAVARSTSAMQTDHTSAMPYLRKMFTLSAPATVITAHVHYSGITPAAGNAAYSPDGYALGLTWIGAQIQDSGCAPADCGASTARVDVRTDAKDSLLGRPATATADDSSSSQVLTVTLRKADGSALPAGTVAIDGWITAGANSFPLSCSTNGDCPAGGTPQTGTARMGTSATITSIDWTIS
jgi:hypothetical protein